MADYPNHIEIAQTLLSQQGEINALKARIEAALKLVGKAETTYDLTYLPDIRVALTGEEVSRG